MSESAPPRRSARVPGPADGMRLDRFLANAFPRWSRRRLAQVARAGEVRVNGRPARPGTLLRAGDTLEIPGLGEALAGVERRRREVVRAREEARAPRQVVVLHRDPDLLVVSKPAGMPVHGGADLGAVETLIDRLKADVLEGFGLVHRLDRDTSGAIALVRGEVLRAETAKRLGDPQGGVEKVYEAIVEGVADPASGEIDLPLAPPDGRGRVVVDRAHGRPALTRYALLEAFAEASRLRLELGTGRTHQIRAHLRAIGHPLLVDPRYGNRRGWRLVDPRGILDARLRRTPLHAARLVLPHPRTGETIAVDAPLPGDMRHALEVLRVDAGRRR